MRETWIDALLPYATWQQRTRDLMEDGRGRAKAYATGNPVGAAEFRHEAIRRNELAVAGALSSLQIPEHLLKNTSGHYACDATQWPHDPVVSQTEVTVIAPDAVDSDVEDDLPFRPQCAGGALVAVLDRPVEEWDRRLVVHAVSSDERMLTVEHEGRVQTLTPQHPATDAFRGTRLGGPWRVTTPLGPSERCGDATSPPPDLLTLTVGVGCAR